MTAHRREWNDRNGRWPLIALLLLLTSPVWSCSVPVFRYALERWAPSDYELWIFHHGALDAEQQRLAQDLDRLLIEGPAHANVQVRWADVAGTLSPAAAKAWAGRQGAALPHAVLRFAPHGAAQGDALAGPLDLARIRTWLRSPVRGEVVGRLLDGDSAVWLFVESGDAARDAKAFAVLERTLTQMAQDLKLPEPDPNDNDVRLAERDTPLRISFPVVRVSRQDPVEAGLLDLLSSMSTPAPSAGQPLAVAIAGQGRVIAMLGGDEIDAGYISAWCEFIAGPCSCQVKAELPGSDLLMLADWTQLKDGRRVEEPEVPNVAEVGALTGRDAARAVHAPGKPSTLPAPSAPAVITPEPAGSSLLGRLSVVAGAVIVLLGGLTWLVLRRRGG